MSEPLSPQLGPPFSPQFSPLSSPLNPRSITPPQMTPNVIKGRVVHLCMVDGVARIDTGKRPEHLIRFPKNRLPNVGQVIEAELTHQEAGFPVGRLLTG